MIRYLILLLLLVSIKVSAEGSDIIVDYDVITPVKVHELFVLRHSFSINDLPNLVEREEKLDLCVTDYIDSQTKTYAKIVKNNLYDLLHNFDRIVSKIYGDKVPVDDVSYEEKIRSLARVQCETYYDMGVLK